MSRPGSSPPIPLETAAPYAGWWSCDRGSRSSATALPCATPAGSPTSSPSCRSEAMTESVFLAEGEQFTPTEHARGPWDPHALHGGAPAALMTAAFERMQPGAELRIARLGFELLRPIPFAPLSVATRIVRPGRRVQELAGELRSGEELICRASALRVREVPADAPATAPVPEEAPMPGPDSGTPVRFALNDADGASFATAMEMRWLDDPWTPGP